MTEHVHYWCDPHIFPSREQNYWVCHYEGCDERLTFKEAEARLNATERLSANKTRHMARVFRNISLELYAEWIVALLDYSDILEGKDE